MAAAEYPDISLGPFKIDRRSRTITRAGVSLGLGGRAIDVLMVLAEASGETVSKDTLLERAWPGLTVEENNLQVQISSLRKALGEAWIVTVPGRGYRLAVPAGASDPSPTTQLAEKPSIAVLPFANLSGDTEQEYFADGVADEIITELSRIRSFFVIARNSSFTYKGRAVDVRQVGRDLGVRYVLEGSVRRSGDRVRVSAQLINTETGEHVWGDRYDRELVDVFAVQDEVTAAVAQSIEPAISMAEQRRAARKPPGSLSAWEAYQRGLWHYARPTAEDHKHARELFEQAIARDPTFAPPHYLRAFLFIADSAAYLASPAVEAARLAAPLVHRAINLDPHDGEAQAIAAIVDAWSGDWGGALARAGQAVAMNPSSFLAHRARGFCLIHFRRHAEARAELQTCLRLNSRDPQNRIALLQLALSYYLDGNYPEALDVAQKAIRLYPSEPQGFVTAAAALGQLGRSLEGQEALRRAETLRPPSQSFRTPWAAPFKHAEDLEHLLDGLRKAGWADTSDS